MRRTILLPALLSLLISGGLATGCNILGVIVGSGNTISQTFDLTGFSRVSASHAFAVEIKQSESYSIKITMDDNLTDHMRVTREGDTLILSLKPGYNYNYTHLKAEITMPLLKQLTLSGASRGNMENFTAASDLRLNVSGASQAVLKNMVCNDLDFTISGASRVSGEVMATGDGSFEVSGASSLTLNGKVSDIDARASGASNINLEDFPASDADAVASGASTISVNLSGTLSGNISGASRLFYSGTPTLGSINTSGGSSISKR